MARRALQVCSNPSCPNLTPRGRCDTCKAEARRLQARQRRAAGDPSMNAYSTHTWRQGAQPFLTQHPTCVDCGAPATTRDHVPPRRLLVALGIHDPDHTRWLWPRCKPCHDHKTQTIDVPLLQRWEAGADAAELAEQAMQLNAGVGGHT